MHLNHSSLNRTNKMKKVFLLTLCAILLSLFSFKSEKRVDPKFVKAFIGYINGDPVFDSHEEKILYVLKEKLGVLTKYSSDYLVRSVKNQYICYREKAKTGFNIIISANGKENKYPVLSNLTYVAIGQNGTVYYTDLKAANAIRSVSINNQVKSIGISGYVIDIVDGYLYYSKIHDPNIEGANADIFRYDFKTNKSQKVLTNVAGENTIIVPGQKYIYDQVLTAGEYKPIVYSVEDKKYALLPVSKKFFTSALYYSYKKNCLIYYNDDASDEISVDIPKTFTVPR